MLRNYKAMQDLAEAEDRKRSRNILGRRMKSAGIPRPNGYEPHHIVARNDKRAEVSRSILEKFGIDINDAANGVFLPPDKSSPSIANEAPHRAVHTDRYYEALDEALMRANTKQKAIDALAAVAAALQFGGYP